LQQYLRTSFEADLLEFDVQELPPATLLTIAEQLCQEGSKVDLSWSKIIRCSAATGKLGIPLFLDLRPSLNPLLCSQPCKMVASAASLLAHVFVAGFMTIYSRIQSIYPANTTHTIVLSRNSSARSLNDGCPDHGISSYQALESFFGPVRCTRWPLWQY
jgi:hypothetical protein